MNSISIATAGRIVPVVGTGGGGVSPFYWNGRPIRSIEDVIPKACADLMYINGRKRKKESKCVIDDITVKILRFHVEQENIKLKGGD